MINWNDIRVEQQIAQERYQKIIARGQGDATPNLLLQGRNWVGTLLITWGHQLRRDESFVPQNEWVHSLGRGC